MKIVMTLLTRDNADVVDAHVAFHLNVGVDHVVATDNGSTDGTVEILERYARDGYVDLAHEPGRDIRQGEWVTSMARRAASEHHADWVINSDADEFWWPRGGSLKEVLEPVPQRYGVVRAPWRQFPPRPDDGGTFAERMTVRLTPRAPINDPASPFRPQAKILHRGEPDVVVGSGNHHLERSRLVPLRGWSPVEVLHFPIRSLAQCEQKYVAAAAAWSTNPRGGGTAYHAKAYRAYENGRLAEYYASVSVDDAALERGVADGSLAVDTRLRDALREIRRPDGTFRVPRAGEPGLRLPAPDLRDEAEYAVDLARLGRVGRPG